MAGKTNNKKKIAFIAVLSAFTLVGTGAISSCNKQEETSKFKIVKDTITSDLFSISEIEIECDLEGTILWSSSDQTIAKVDEYGYVHTFNKEGTVTITGKIGQYEDKCTLNVYSNQDFELKAQYPAINIPKNELFELPYSVNYGGEDVSSLVDVQWTFEDENLIDVQQTENLKTIGLLGKTTGLTTMTLYCNFKSDVIATSVEISVVENSYSLLHEELDGEPGGAACYSKSMFMDGKLSLSGFELYNSNQKVAEGKQLTYFVEDQDVASLSEDYIVPQKIGDTLLRVSYMENEFYVAIHILKEKINWDDVYTVDKLHENTLSITFPNDKEIKGTPTDFKFVKTNKSIFKDYDTSTKTLNIDKQKIPYFYNELGEQDIMLETTSADYYFKGIFYTGIVNNINDLNSLRTVCKVDKDYYNGYVVLNSDIDLTYLTNNIIFPIESNVGTYASTSNGWSGVFEGNGHTLRNYTTPTTYSGLFGGKLNSTGVIRNLQIENVKLLHERGAVIAPYGSGTITNLSIQITQLNGKVSGALFSQWVQGYNIKPTGIFLDYSSITSGVNIPTFIPTSWQSDSGFGKVVAIIKGTFNNIAAKGSYFESLDDFKKVVSTFSGEFASPYWKLGDNAENKVIEFAKYESIKF